ncbi:MAG: hypothetical protein MRERV_27c034 [Mycoplasmataceae bacterium RV_VA103A]|nr:MAG: hypothetical protein MRERV_27c034 [Mycoplasmataceae bacterium RV_VA103A]
MRKVEVYLLIIDFHFSNSFCALMAREHLIFYE